MDWNNWMKQLLSSQFIKVLSSQKIKLLSSQKIKVLSSQKCTFIFNHYLRGAHWNILAKNELWCPTFGSRRRHDRLDRHYDDDYYDYDDYYELIIILMNMMNVMNIMMMTIMMMNIIKQVVTTERGSKHQSPS